MVSLPTPQAAKVARSKEAAKAAEEAELLARGRLEEIQQREAAIEQERLELHQKQQVQLAEVAITYSIPTLRRVSTSIYFGYARSMIG